MKSPFNIASLFRGGASSGERNVIARMTWDAVEARIKNGAAAILPIGAGSKGHGLHLPMNVDQIQSEYIASRLSEKIDALIWPTVTYGHYPAFVAYPGSSNLSAPAYEAVVGEIVAGILVSGVRAVIVIDTGISTIAPTERALARFKHTEVLHLRVHQGMHYRQAASRLVEQRYGSHADELETSLMLAMAPEIVMMARAEASPSDRGGAPGPLTRTDAASPNYSPSGSYGDPTKATRAKGDVLLAAMMTDVIERAEHFVAGAGSDGSQQPSQRSGSGSVVQ